MTAPDLAFVMTPDGARLALYRYRPQSTAARREPVLLLSGYGLNRHALDFDDRYSWARRIAAAGFDTWMLELRGAGLSAFAGASDGSFDDYIVDARTAVAHVLQHTGAARLHWVGYSLGGMLLYALLASAPDAAPVRSGVAIEAPVNLSAYHVDRISRFIVASLQRTRIAQRIRYSAIVRLLRPMLPLLVRRQLFARWMNVDNIDPVLVRPMLVRVIDDVPMALAVQLLEWVDNGRWISSTDGGDLLARLGDVRVPILLLTGSGDFSRPAREALDRCAAGTMAALECSVRHGFSADYGHADLVFGRRAPDEVFPHVLAWLARHDHAAAHVAQPAIAGNLAVT